MKFEFRLERLKDLKKILEDNARIELGKKSKQRQLVEDEINQISNKIDTFSTEFIKEVKDTISITKLSNMIEYKNYLNEQLSLLHSVLQEKLEEEEIARQNYLKAKNEKDILQKLKDKRFDDFKIQEKRADIKELDEIARLNHHPGEENYE
ncbi:flagellar export protein FliJ [Petrotoga sp. DB-2]